MGNDNKIERGSEWRKWDLHLHSFSSSTQEEYIRKIKDENIEVVGLTNYFNFGENDWILKNKLEDEGIVVFLNLELRLTYTNKEDDCCDLHLIFSNELKKQDIDTFLTKLNCSISGRKKTLNTVTSEDEKKIAVVEFNKVDETLNDHALINLKDKVLIGMLSRGKGSSRSSTMYESLTKDSDFIIHSTSKVEKISDDIKYWTGSDVEKPLACKALFQSSDAHNVDKIGEKYSWVKGNPCFETLSQAVVDYENRILIQERNPAENKNSSPELFIDKDDDVSFITVDNEAFFGLSQTTLDLIEKHIEKLSNQQIKAYLDSLLTDLANKIKTKKKEKSAVAKKLDPINEKLKKNKTIEKILKEISKLDGEEREIEKLNKFVQESNKKKVELIGEVADLYLSFKDKIEGIVQTLKDEFNNFTPYPAFLPEESVPKNARVFWIN
ncbi:MAG: hypothetical protein ABIE74_01660 [Pseudomonadota bacterium]